MKKRKTFRFIIVCGLICILLGTVITAATYNYGSQHYSGQLAEVETYAQNFDINAVNSIQIFGVSASVYIEKGDRFSVVAENVPKDSFSIELTPNGILDITMNRNGNLGNYINFLPLFPVPIRVFNWQVVGWGPNNIFSSEYAKIYVYIPDSDEKIFNNLWIMENVGNIKIDNIKCDNLNMFSNVGNVSIDNFYTDSLYLTDGVGRVDLTGTVGKGKTAINGRVGNTNLNLLEPSDGEIFVNGGVGIINIDAAVNNTVRIEGGVGNIVWNGAINGDLYIDGGVGSINFNLAGNSDDYNISTSSGVGNIHINGFKTNYNVDYNTAKYNIEIYGGIGSIKLDIK